MAVLAGLLGAGPLAAAPDCDALRRLRDQRAAEALRAEVALVQTIRRRLCPRQEDQAEAGDATGAALDLDAWLRCRHAAEEQLRRTRRVLYRNGRGFPYYTPEGADLGRQADEARQAIRSHCPVRGGA